MTARRIGIVLLATLLAGVHLTPAPAANWHHRRSSAIGPAPAYWGGEGRPPRLSGLCCLAGSRLNPIDARIAQLDQRSRPISRTPELPGPLPESYNPNIPPDTDAFGLPILQGVPPVIYLQGFKNRLRFFRRYGRTAIRIGR